MSSRRVHLPPDRIAAGRAELTDEARHYLRDVLRLLPGAKVELFDGAGAAWDATVADGFEALLLGPRREAPRAGTPIALLFALSKGEKVDLVVQKATELGASLVAPFAAERSVVRLDAERGADRVRRWRRIAEEAARQCGRADVPDVLAPAPLAAALAALPPRAVVFVLDVGGAPLAAAPGGAPLAAGASTPAAPPAPVYAAVVGPEGGLTDAELAACERAGARRAGLGPRVLRAETAAIAAVTVLQARFGDLG